MRANWQKYGKPTCWGNGLSGQISSITCDRHPPSILGNSASAPQGATCEWNQPRFIKGMGDISCWRLSLFFSRIVGRAWKPSEEKK